jgi:hypothetical protein
LKYCPVCGDIIYDEGYTTCVDHMKGMVYQARLDRIIPELDDRDDQRKP